jgi:hypothetical protein
MIFFNRGSFKIENGKTAMFWEDIWLEDHSLANQYPLYNIVRRKPVPSSVLMEIL